MQVSIALCTYNGARHLPAQLESIGAQSRAPLEMVVCDDGSTDQTVEVVESFAKQAHFPVRLFRNAENLGSTKNFEKAMNLCRGEAIALCDQDDLWEPGKLALLTAVLEAEPTVAGVFSNAYLINDAGKKLSGDLWSRFGFTPAQQRRFDRGHAPRQLIQHDTVTGATLVFRSSWLPWLLPIPATWVHDGWIALLLASMAELRALPVCVMSYRLHPAQQIGAAQAALSNHLSTPVEEAREFHRANLSRWEFMLERMEAIAERAASEPQKVTTVVEDLRRRIDLARGRLSLLSRPRWRRLVPALRLLRGYVQFEKGVLSLLRDLAHREPGDGAA